MKFNPNLTERWQEGNLLVKFVSALAAASFLVILVALPDDINPLQWWSGSELYRSPNAHAKGIPPWKGPVLLTSDGEGRLIIGAPRKLDRDNIARYIGYRRGLLNRMAAQQPGQTVQAIVLLDAFLTPGEVVDLVGNRSWQVEELFVASPNIRGGGGIILRRGDSIPERVRNFQQTAAEKGVQGELSIFALTVRAPLRALIGLEDPVRLVDVFSYPEGEAVVEEKAPGDWVFVAAPLRPDGLP